MPVGTVREIENFLYTYHVEPKPNELPDLPLHDRSDLLIVGSALAVKADILLTGDRELLDLKQKPENLRILSPREFWDLTVGKKKRADR